MLGLADVAGSSTLAKKTPDLMLPSVWIKFMQFEPSVPFRGITRIAIWHTGVAGTNVPDAPRGECGAAIIIVLPGLAFVWQLPKTMQLQCSGARKVTLIKCRELRRSKSNEIPLLHTFTRHRGKRARAYSQSHFHSVPILAEANPLLAVNSRSGLTAYQEGSV